MAPESPGPTKARQLVSYHNNPSLETRKAPGNIRALPRPRLRHHHQIAFSPRRIFCTASRGCTPARLLQYSGGWGTDINSLFFLLFRPGACFFASQEDLSGCFGKLLSAQVAFGQVTGPHLQELKPAFTTATTPYSAELEENPIPTLTVCTLESHTTVFLTINNTINLHSVSRNLPTTVALALTSVLVSRQ